MGGILSLLEGKVVRCPADFAKATSSPTGARPTEEVSTEGAAGRLAVTEGGLGGAAGGEGVFSSGGEGALGGAGERAVVLPPAFSTLTWTGEDADSLFSRSTALAKRVCMPLTYLVVSHQYRKGGSLLAILKISSMKSITQEIPLGSLALISTSVFPETGVPGSGL